MTNRSLRPYAVLGAGNLTSSLYKTGDELIGFHYRFNIVHLNSTSGRVGHWLAPDDIVSLVKLARVMAAELANDGCMDVALRRQLHTINSLLTGVLDQTALEIPAEGK